MRKSLLLPFLAILFSISSFAQNYFTIQVGTFLEARTEDFQALQSLGFVHADKLQGNTYQVYLGGFENRANAERVAGQVRAKGYASAFIQERFLSDGETVTVIQIATKSAAKPIEWDRYLKAGDLYAILIDDKVKLVTGPYRDVAAAKNELPAIRKLGFKDAFVKNVNSVFLTRITDFESGIKKELIPLSFDNTSRRRSEIDNNRTITSRVPSEPIPGSYDIVMPRSPGTTTTTRSTTVSATYLPNIRSNVKRRSVIELQRVLKAENAYPGSLDGLYGQNTARAFEQVLNANREIQKYRLLGQHLDQIGKPASENHLQRAINELFDNPDAPRVLDGYNSPIAKAYQAYLLYDALGPNNEVNSLMNSAIREAFSQARLENQPPFDYRATYAYNNLEQLILHIHYIHGAPGTNISVPCWLYQLHPRETTRAYETFANFSTTNFNLQGCDNFLTWEEIRTLQSIATDLNPDKQFDSSELARAASRRAKLSLAPTALNPAETQVVENWDRDLWVGVNTWASRDPLNQRIVTAFKIMYFQSQVRLEDYFMDKGYQPDEAKGLALATLQSIVGYHLRRFI